MFPQPPGSPSNIGGLSPVVPHSSERRYSQSRSRRRSRGSSTDSLEVEPTRGFIRFGGMSPKDSLPSDLIKTLDSVPISWLSGIPGKLRSGSRGHSNGCESVSPKNRPESTSPGYNIICGGRDTTWTSPPLIGSRPLSGENAPLVPIALPGSARFPTTTTTRSRSRQSSLSEVTISRSRQRSLSDEGKRLLHEFAVLDDDEIDENSCPPDNENRGAATPRPVGSIMSSSGNTLKSAKKKRPERMSHAELAALLRNASPLRREARANLQKYARVRNTAFASLGTVSLDRFGCSNGRVLHRKKNGTPFIPSRSQNSFFSAEMNSDSSPLNSSHYSLRESESYIYDDDVNASRAYNCSYTTADTSTSTVFDYGEKEDDKILYFTVQDVTFHQLPDTKIKKSYQEELNVSTSSVLSNDSSSSRIRLKREGSGMGKRIVINGVTLALFRYGDKAYAIEDKCSHAGGELHKGYVGDIEDILGPNVSSKGLSGQRNNLTKQICVACPRHNFCFDLATGAIVAPAGKEYQQMVYPVRINVDGHISIGFSSVSETIFEEDF